MKCPVCGCKMKSGICPYCNITEAQVLASSNQEGKKAIKEHNRRYVHYTTVLPSDVSRKKLFWLSLLLGWTGAQNFYVGKQGKAWFSAIVSTLVIVFSILFTISSLNHWVITNILYMIIELLVIPTIVMLFIWLVDIINVITKNFKVPILIQGKENK